MLPLITRIGRSAPKRKVKRLRRRNRQVRTIILNFHLHIDICIRHFFIQTFVILGRSADRATPSTSEDIIELQDVRMSPIASLRNRHYPPSAPDDFDSGKFPPSFRITRPYGAVSRTGLRQRNSRHSNRPKMLHALKRGASVIRNSMPKIKDVNIIDKYSRVIFPVSFLAFNIGYWSFYMFE
jgi:gamma-aminobutyric acid receptor subunit beta